MNFSAEEKARYARHFVLPGFGQEGQQKLRRAKVLVIGAGGLGSPLMMYLAAAGVGTIGIVDHDRVDRSNLQRQVMYTEADIGKLKVEVARARLLQMNPHIQINIFSEKLDRNNALQIIGDYDVVADGTDNFPTRYLVNDACLLSDKPNVYASVFRFEGQVAVFNGLDRNGERGPNYRDLFPQPPPPGLVPNCAEGGILGVLPGIIGSMQALEVIKLISGVGEPLIGKIMHYDTASQQSRIIKIKKTDHEPVRELIDYDVFCGLEKYNAKINTISPEKLHQFKEQLKVFQLIDVRERVERETDHIGGVHIPLNELEENTNQIERDQMVVIYCQSGQRSAKAVQLLSEKIGLENLFNLEGGLNQYRREYPLD